MKVIELLDKIFFDGGEKDMLPILKKFAGSPNSEIFGIDDNYATDKKRVMIAEPITVQAKDSFRLHLGDNTGSSRRVGKLIFSKDELYAIYGAIMGDAELLKEVSNANIDKAATFLDSYIVKSKTESMNKGLNIDTNCNLDEAFPNSQIFSSMH